MRIRGKILVRQLISCGMQSAQTAREHRLTIFFWNSTYHTNYSYWISYIIYIYHHIIKTFLVRLLLIGHRCITTVSLQRHLSYRVQPAGGWLLRWFKSHIKIIWSTFIDSQRAQTNYFVWMCNIIFAQWLFYIVLIQTLILLTLENNTVTLLFN